MTRPALLALALLLATPADAAAIDRFRAGDWAAAAREGRAEATPASLVLAGRSELSLAGYGVTDKAAALAGIARAEADFGAALAKAPGNADALLQKAIAMGYRAKLTRGIGEAKDVRRRFEAVRAAHPDKALAWAALGGWHGGAVATVGSFMAGTVLGAKKGEVERNFAQAIRLEPNMPSHRVFHAFTLLDLGPDNAAAAAATLKGVGQMPAADGYEALLRSQGVQLAAKLAAGDAKGAQALARRLQPFGTVG